MNSGRGPATRRLFHGPTAILQGRLDKPGWAEPAKEAEESESGTFGLNPIQGFQDSPPYSLLPSPNLHLSSTSASGRLLGPPSLPPIQRRCG